MLDMQMQHYLIKSAQIRIHYQARHLNIWMKLVSKSMFQFVDISESKVLTVGNSINRKILPTDNRKRIHLLLFLGRQPTFVSTG